MVPGQTKLIPPDYAIVTKLVQYLLQSPRLKAMVDRLEQRRHLIERVGPMLLRHDLQMLLKPKMARLPRLFAFVAELCSTVLTHERMRV